MINIGLGFMRHDLSLYKLNKKMINHAINNNVKYFETGLGYLNFQCEDYVYSLLKDYSREKYNICGKLPVQGYCQYNDFKKTYYEQLKKVPNNYFDFYLLQAINPIVNYEIIEQNMLSFFIEEKQKGNIVNLGFSTDCDSRALSCLLPLIKWDIAQIPLNYFDWYLCGAEQNYNLIQQFNIPIIAQAPLKGGFLINQLENNEKIILNNQLFNAAIYFIQKLSNIKYILTGCTSINHLNNYLKYNNDNVFTEQQYKQVIESYKKRATINCLGCNKCYNSCLKKVPISAFFKLYNKGLYSYNNFLDLMDLKYCYEEPSIHCINCNDKNCEKVCPQHLPIKQFLSNNIFYLRT